MKGNFKNLSGYLIIFIMLFGLFLARQREKKEDELIKRITKLAPKLKEAISEAKSDSIKSEYEFPIEHENKPTINLISEDEEIEVIEASLDSLKLVLSSLKDSIEIEIYKIHQPYWGNLSSMPYVAMEQLINMEVFYFESSNGIERIDDLLLHISVLPNTNQFGKRKILERLKKLCENINNSNIEISARIGASKVERQKDFGSDTREINRIVVDCGISILSKYSN